jgi:uncharacterized protein with ATP-grasp and redox domains
MVSDDPAVHEQIIREVFGWISKMDLADSPPALAQRIHTRLREVSGVDDPYAKDKREHNQLALGLLPSFRQQIAGSDDPLLMAARFAIAGNIIDLGAKSGLDENHILDSFRDAAEQELLGDIAAFKQAVADAKTILYLADNAGEIVCDRLLVEQLGPERVTLAVRGRPIINDATRIDAETAGLTELTTVIDNGAGAPGTILEECSAEFREIFERADVIISKGQGNFESLSGKPRNIFFLFKVKCPVVAEASGLPLGSHVLRHNQ